MSFRTTEVVAHRGGAAEAPENSLRAIRRARCLGVAAVEIDVQLSRDGVVFVYHDDLVRRTHGGAGERFQDLGAAEIDRLDVGEGGPPEPPPRLRDVVALGWTPRQRLMVEAKSGSQNQDLVRASLAEIERASSPAAAIVFGSLDPTVLAAYRRLAPSRPGVAILGDAADLDPFRGASPSLWAVSDDLVDGADPRALGPEVWVWTVNDRERARALLDRGIAAVITDRPGALLGP